jgi:hypothetical protein
MLCQLAARQISMDITRFDRLFASVGLRRAASQVLDELVGEFEVCGSEGMPADGPLL